MNEETNKHSESKVFCWIKTHKASPPLLLWDDSRHLPEHCQRDL